MKNRRELKMMVMAALAVLVAVVPVSARGTSFSCAVTANGPYCVYTGLVRYSYVNYVPQVLLGFDLSDGLTSTQIRSELAKVDYEGVHGVVNWVTDATSMVAEEPEFADFLYTTMLAAQLSGRQVTFQMRGVRGGRMRIDRIYLPHF